MMDSHDTHSTMYSSNKDGGKASFSKFVVGGYDVITNATPYVMEALKKIPTLSAHETFTVVDYGTADGGTSMPLMHRIIESLKEKYGDDQEVMIFYEDQPSNDYNSLFLRLYGRMNKEESFLHKFPHVYATVSGRSFYNQCFPEESIHLGVCFTAAHWLRTRPCKLKDVLFHMHSKDKQEIECFKSEAKRNWEVFLLNRAKELKPGGHMIITRSGIFNNEFYLHREKEHSDCLPRELTKVWTMFAEKKIISKDEYERATICFYWQQESEVRAPFLDKDSEVYKSGLQLLSVIPQISPCRLRAEFVRAYEEGDAASARQYAKKLMFTMRTWTNSTFLGALDDKRSEDQKNKIVDELYLQLEDEIVKCPTCYVQDFTYYIIHIQKDVPKMQEILCD